MFDSSTKSPSSFKTVSSLIHSQAHSQLRDNKQNLAQLQDLQKIWRDSLPRNLTAHSNVALINEREIVIYADSPVWANKLTQIQEKLLKILWNKGCTGNQKLVIRVTQSMPAHLKKTSSRSLTKRASNCLSAAAADISDPELKQALLSLSRQTR